MKLFRGCIIHSLGLGHLEIIRDGAIGVNKQGIIAFVKKNAAELTTEEMNAVEEVIDLGKHKFLIPGFVDTHAHAPQYVNAGTGMDLPLLEWLNKYTFPKEAKFAQREYAKDAFTKSVRRHLRNGTTTCCYFATIHLEASVLLAEIIQQHGQRAYVGKVNMDRNSPDYYIESTEDSIRDTEQFIKRLRALNSSLVTPIITPRFVPTCSEKLMQRLGELAREYSLPIQSHVSENEGEVKWVSELHPEIASYTEVYDRFGLLNDRTIMAHGIYLSKKELDLLKERGSSISHCPSSNFNLGSGVFNMRRALANGNKVGIGSDVSGGHSASMLDALRQTITASTVISFDPKINSNRSIVDVDGINDNSSSSTSSQTNDNQHQHPQPLNFKEAFHLITLGGAESIGLGDRIGNFVPGKEFDALIVDPNGADGHGGNSPFDVFEDDDTLDVFQKFLYLGDDRNIAAAYVQGRQVLPFPPQQ
eukprot:GEZU01036096.1.p1 GENE.GEZU01036096.1~~GEZU01036096.1.p1  ORF type:complete len:475 (-),score=161.78 GEZU01036096.1:23-1447(-)